MLKDGTYSASLKPMGSESIKSEMEQKLTENGLKLMKRAYPDLLTKELPKVPETGKIELELSNTLDDLYNNFYQQFMDQVQPKKLIDFLKNFTAPLNLTAQTAAGTYAASHASAGQVPEKEVKRSNGNKRDVSKPVSKRVDFLSPPMPPMPPQMAEFVDEAEMNELNNVKDTIESKLGKLYTYGNQYRNFALEFLSQYLSLLGDFGMQFKDLGASVVKSIGAGAGEAKNNDKILF